MRRETQKRQGFSNMGNPPDGDTMKGIWLLALPGSLPSFSHFTSQSLSIIFSDPPISLFSCKRAAADYRPDLTWCWWNFCLLFQWQKFSSSILHVKGTTIVLRYNCALSVSQQLFGPWRWGKLSVSFLPYKFFADRAKCRLSKEGSNKFMIFDVVDFGLLDSSSPVDSYCPLLFPQWLFAV